MKIGSTNFDGNKKEYFKLEANADNHFRPLPPLFSLADKGQFAKYYATHSIWIKNEFGKSRPYHFQCIEKVNRETKMIERHCPFCDLAREKRREYDVAKEQGVDKEQLQSFLYNQVLPWQVKKQFYINAVNLENKVGVLTLGIKAFRALQDRLNQVRSETNIDATGIEGLFFNFRKTQKFKGDRDTQYAVDMSMENFTENGVMMMRPRSHVITDNFIKYLEGAARDLGTMFKEISAEDISALVSVSEEGRKELCDRIFGRAEKAQTEVHVGGTNTTVVPSVTADHNGMTVNSPMPVAAPAQSMVQPAPAQPAAAPAPAQQVTPQPAPAQPAVGKTTGSGDMSDEDFVNTFMGG